MICLAIDDDVEAAGVFAEAASKLGDNSYGHIGISFTTRINDVGARDFTEDDTVVGLEAGLGRLLGSEANRYDDSGRSAAVGLVLKYDIGSHTSFFEQLENGGDTKDGFRAGVFWAYAPHLGNDNRPFKVRITAVGNDDDVQYEIRLMTKID